jgi:hypothetical protein
MPAPIPIGVVGPNSRTVDLACHGELGLTAPKESWHFITSAEWTEMEMGMTEEAMRQMGARELREMTETGRRAIFVGGQKGWMESTDTGFTAAARRGRSSRQSKALAKEGTADTRVRGTCLSSQVAGARAGATESLTVTAAVKCLLRTVTTTTTLTLALTPKLGPVKDLEVLVLTLGSLVLRLTPALSLQLQVLRAWSHLEICIGG